MKISDSVCKVFIYIYIYIYIMYLSVYIFTNVKRGQYFFVVDVITFFRLISKNSVSKDFITQGKFIKHISYTVVIQSALHKS